MTDNKILYNFLGKEITVTSEGSNTIREQGSKYTSGTLIDYDDEFLKLSGVHVPYSNFKSTLLVPRKKIISIEVIEK